MRDVSFLWIAVRPYVEKGMLVPAALVEDSSGEYLFGPEECAGDSSLS